MYHRILVPLDGSSVAEEAILCSGTVPPLRRHTHAGARCPSATQPPALYSMTDAETWFIRQRQMQAEAELYLAEIATRPELIESNPRRLVIAGDADQSLLALTEQESFDVLVMATRARRDPIRWVLGSIADYLVQRTPIPVLLVRQRET
ncbi:MAG: universal stress protein [Chloroflexi bacterium]|nr:universal stress protein [Chloroflexota bacterium]